MPLYEFRCTGCGNEVALVFTFAESEQYKTGEKCTIDKVICDKCNGKEFKRLASAHARMPSWGNWSGR